MGSTNGKSLRIDGLAMQVEGPSGGRGKWAMPGVPHRGWQCVNVEDLSEPSMTCQMCESAEIRFVHYMRNDRYPDVLACGAICAGHMESDLARAERRDKKMRSDASKRKRFPTRAGWRVNSKGNYLLKANGYRITIFRKGLVWGAVVSRPPIETGFFTRETFVSVDAAKMAAFDTMMFMEDSIPRPPPFRFISG